MILTSSAFPQVGSLVETNKETKGDVPGQFSLDSSTTIPLTIISNRDTNDVKLRKNAVYASGGYALLIGSGIGSLERAFYQGGQGFIKYWAVRFGVGKYGSFGGSGLLYLGTLNMLSGAGSGHFEIDVGLVRVDGGDGEKGTFPAGVLGYRYQEPGGYFLFRIGAGFPEGAYLSLGFVF